MFFARFVGHTPRKLPAFAATSRFNAYQALLLYSILGQKASLFSYFLMIFQENFAHLKKIFLDILHKQRKRYILFICVRYNRGISYEKRSFYD